MSDIQNRIIRVAYAKPELRKAALELVANYRTLMNDPAFKRGVEKGFVDVERAYELLGRAQGYDLVDGLYLTLNARKPTFLFDPNERLTQRELDSVAYNLQDIYREQFGIMDEGDYGSPTRVEGDKLARDLKFTFKKVKGRMGTGYRVVPNAALEKLLALYDTKKASRDVEAANPMAKLSFDELFGELRSAVTAGNVDAIASIRGLMAVKNKKRFEAQVKPYLTALMLQRIQKARVGEILNLTMYGSMGKTVGQMVEVEMDYAETSANSGGSHRAILYVKKKPRGRKSGAILHYPSNDTIYYQATLNTQIEAVIWIS